MRNLVKKLAFGARVLLSRGNGQQETIALPGRNVALRHHGEGPTFVYLHSAMGEAAMWLPFMQTWSKRFHVYVPQHPGFGASTGFDRVDAIEDMAFAYAELFDALGLEEFVLVGHSLGGWIAAEYAIRWPERVTKLVISGAPGLWVDDHPPADLFRLVQDRDAMRSLLFHDPAGPMASLVMKENPTEQELLFGYQAMTVLARLVWHRPYDPKLAERLYRIACPTLVLWGADDKLVPMAHGEAYHRLVPGSTFAAIAECGHLPMFEREAEYVAKILEFVGG
jgi:pimeloyl-ACP methyl ester carboxylesterase